LTYCAVIDADHFWPWQASGDRRRNAGHRLGLPVTGISISLPSLDRAGTATSANDVFKD
jgi:hypothetical protein